MSQVINWINRTRERFNEDSFANLIWIINFLPSLAGFSLSSNNLNELFWIIHMVLLFYVYISGTIVYLTYYAQEFFDFVNSVFNIFVFVLIFITSWLILFNRSSLSHILILSQKNDDLIKESGRFSEQHLNQLKWIKKILIACYIFHFVNDVCIFIPSRTVNMDNFSLASCFGLHPLVSYSDRIICSGILAAQELTAIVAVGTYDVTLLFLFTHTTAVFQMLYEEMMDFSKLTETYHDTPETTSEVACRLKCLVNRHSLALHTVQKLQEFYSVPIGIGFGIDAISMCVFFVLPLELCLVFAPLIYHSIFVFFLYCYQGQRLTTASNKFEMAVYCCGWEKLRVKDQKSILLMLKQAQNPVILLAAGLIPICIRTFAVTMQNIYKFVTIFKV